MLRQAPGPLAQGQRAQDWLGQETFAHRKQQRSHPCQNRVALLLPCGDYQPEKQGCAAPLDCFAPFAAGEAAYELAVKHLYRFILH